MNLNTRIKDLTIPRNVLDWWNTTGRSCKADPSAFIKHCIQLPTPNGMVEMRPFRAQDDLAYHFTKHRVINVMHARQVGASSVTRALMMWQAAFRNDQTIVYMAANHHITSHAANMIRLMYDHLPEELKAGFQIVKNNKMEIEFSNGSRILFKPATVNALRGYTINLLVMEHMSFVEHKDVLDILECVIPVVMSGKYSKILNVDSELPINVDRFLSHEAFPVYMKRSRVF